MRLGGPEILTLLVVFGGVGALIGYTAKRRAILGFILGLVLGPIGWLVVALFPLAGPKCPYCKGVVIRGAVKCKNCGSDLQEASA